HVSPLEGEDRAPAHAGPQRREDDRVQVGGRCRALRELPLLLRGLPSGAPAEVSLGTHLDLGLLATATQQLGLLRLREGPDPLPPWPLVLFDPCHGGGEEVPVLDLLTEEGRERIALLVRRRGRELPGDSLPFLFLRQTVGADLR